MQTSNRVEIEFQYNHIDHGTVSVEAVFLVEKPDFYSRESDWDYNGLQYLEYYAVFKGGKQVYVDIGDDVLYHHLRDYLRNIEINGCFNREGSF